MNVDVTGIPLCTSCGHHHIQGVKCHICGHVGRSQIYCKMKIRANEKRDTKAIIYDGSSFQVSLDDWDVIMELRKAIYCDEGLIPIDVEFNEVQEKRSRHLLYYVGDAPIAVARYRILNGPDGVTCIDIDRAGILPAYRGHKFSKLIIADILSDTQNCLKGSPYVIVLSVPVGCWAVEKLESQGWRVKYEENADQRGPKSFLRVTYAAGAS